MIKLRGNKILILIHIDIGICQNYSYLFNLNLVYIVILSFITMFFLSLSVSFPRITLGIRIQTFAISPASRYVQSSYQLLICLSLSLSPWHAHSPAQFV